jgi:hypothetical protein
MLFLWFVILAVAGVFAFYRVFIRRPKQWRAGTHHPRPRDQRGIARGKARAERNPNPMNAIPPVMLDRAAGKIADVCEECGRPWRRPHTSTCKSRGVKIIKNRSGRQPGEKI